MYERTRLIKIRPLRTIGGKKVKTAITAKHAPKIRILIS
jgi:hypothetical protein